MSYGYELLTAWAGAALVMAVFWWVQKRSHVAGIVDVVWALGTALVAIGLVAVVAPVSAERSLLLSLLIGFWGARLALHLFARLRAEKEDGRYAAMKRALGKGRVQPVMFLFFQVQALWAVMFALPVAAASLAPRGELDGLDAAGVLVWLIAIGGEWLSDRQLARFRADPSQKGRVCRAGLWRYSRHPNYFFEWLHWFAYVLIGYDSPYWWVTLAGVAVMGVFLNYVTGIPFTEQQALRSRGDAYRDYQRTTSRFFPLPPMKQEAK
jgi:steroid 5-alpha reductase family enzyme